MRFGKLYKNEAGFKGVLGRVPVLVREESRENGKLSIELDLQEIRETAKRQFAFSPVFSSVFSTAVYEGRIRNEILEIKINRSLKKISFFVEILAGTYFSNSVLSETDVIVPCPHSNDKTPAITKLLCRGLGEKIEKPVLDILSRVKDLEFPQARLGPGERLENVTGAFKITDSEFVKEKICLLVDDIITTGATANECARMLLTAGAKKVYVLTLAQTPRKGNKWEYF